MPKNRQKGKIMKDKFKSLGKRIVALLLSILTVTMMFPLSAFAATENLGAVSGANKLDISVSKHYGHEVHTTKKGGTTADILMALSAISQVDITPNDTLMVLDEIQDCPKALVP